MLVKVTNHEALLVPGALRRVATASGSRSLTAADRRALDAFDRFVLRRDPAYDLEGLPEALPTELAAALQGADARTHVVQFLVAMALDPEKFWLTWERGAEVTTGVFADTWNLWAVAGEPLDDLQDAYHVCLLDSAHAAGGHVPPWHKPVP